MAGTYQDTPWSEHIHLEVEYQEHYTAEATATWHAMDCDLVSMNLGSGRADWASDFDPATVTVTLRNESGKWNPEASGALLQVGYVVRVMATDLHSTAKTPHPLFTGTIYKMDERNAPDGASLLTVTAVDDISKIASGVMEVVTGPMAGENPKHHLRERIDYILDAIHYPASLRDLPAAGHGFELAASPMGRDAMTEIREAVFGAEAMLYVSRDGKITAKAVDDTHSIDVKFLAKQGAHPDAGATPIVICPSGFTIDRSKRWVVSDVALTNLHGRWTHHGNAQSRARYGIRTYARSGVATISYTGETPNPAYDPNQPEGPDNPKEIMPPSVPTDDLYRLAAKILSRQAAPHPYINTVTFPVADAATARYVADLMEVGDNVAVDFHHEAGWGHVTDRGHVVGWVVTVDRNRFTVTLRTGDPLAVSAGVTSPSTQANTDLGGSQVVIGGGQAGPPGPSGPQGPKGAQGPEGVRGTMWFEGPTTPTASNPPAPTGGFLPGDAYLHTTDGELYLWQGTAWSDSGVSLIGPEGPRGIQGIQGPPGVRGTMWSHGPTTPGQPHVPPGGWVKGDVWLHETDGELYLFGGTTWSDEGFSIRGDQGPPGPHGTAIHVLGTVPTKADLPMTGNSDADVHFVVDLGDLYIWEHLPGDPAGGAWHDLGHVQGPQGIQGKTGPRGAHGAPGVQGHKGDTGAQGPKGAQGPRGQISDAHGDARYVKQVGTSLSVTSGAFQPNIYMDAHHRLYQMSHPYAASDKRYLPLTGGTVTAATTLGKSQVRNIWTYTSTPPHPVQGDIWIHW